MEQVPVPMYRGNPWEQTGCQLILLPGRALSWNEVLSVHYERRAVMIREIKSQVISAIHSRKYVQIHEPVTIVFLSYTPKEPIDSDNICSKYYIDALRDARLLPDDNPRYVTCVKLMSRHRTLPSFAEESEKDYLTIAIFSNERWNQDSISQKGMLPMDMVVDGFIPPLADKKELIEEEHETGDGLNPVEFYVKYFGPPSPFVTEKLERLRKDYSSEKLLYALKEAARRDVRKIAYVEAILRRQSGEVA